MSIEYTPVDIACNLKCEYCYQDPMREAGNVTTPRNWEAAKATLSQENYAFAVFGGEPLLAPIEHLEEVFRFGMEKFGRNSIQTNGVLITDAHIELFKKYTVSVGLSVDGPGILNGARCDVETTGKIDRNILKLCAAGIVPSIIVTLTKHNTGPHTTHVLCRWFQYLEGLKVNYINIHILETECGRESQALSDFENSVALARIYEFSKASSITFAPFRDIRRLLLQEETNKTSCIWNSCDPATTDAVHGVSANGTRTNCGRTNKDGVTWVKADKAGSERYLALYQTPQQFGGCKDCRFFAFCKGQCPGTAINNDWRNRTAHCKVWYAMFELVEADILREKRLPVSRSLADLKALEKSLVTKWESTLRDGYITHGDVAHGDAPHGDSHGDSDLVRGVGVTWIGD